MLGTRLSKGKPDIVDESYSIGVTDMRERSSLIRKTSTEFLDERISSMYSTYSESSLLNRSSSISSSPNNCCGDSQTSLYLRDYGKQYAHSQVPHSERIFLYFLHPLEQLLEICIDGNEFSLSSSP